MSLAGDCAHQSRGAADRGEYRQAAGAIRPPSDVGSAISRNISRLARAMESLTSISSQRSFNRRLNARSRAYNLPRGTQSATAHTIKTTRTPIAIYSGAVTSTPHPEHAERLNTHSDYILARKCPI